jgi:hypothetical protein
MVTMNKTKLKFSQFPKKYLYTSTLIFLIKVFIILNINPNFTLDIGNGQGFYLRGILNGPDGENYLTGLLALKSQGIFSQNSILSYFPAGYPILMFALSIFGIGWTMTILSILQSALFSFAVFYFVRQLFTTKLQKFVFLVFLAILLNPTLTLSSLVVGYESLVASGHLLILGILIKDLKTKEEGKSNSIRSLILVSLICSIISFLQPRLILGILLVIFFWVITSFKSRIIYSLFIVALISSIFPTSLVFRNYQASNLFAISTNLGTTMNLGAGNFTTGGYWDERKGVLCNVNESKENKDSSVVRCVLKWYLNNPIKTASLFYHKSIYFWSPWIGPNAEGTTGRNPWLRYGPLEVLNDKESFIQIIQGGFGKFISALWQIFSLFFLFYGLINIYKLRNLERQIGVMSMILILVNWGICLLTIGDHRFRLPILGISVFLQIVGLQFLLRRKLKDILTGH